jgi:hypothetical protein
MTGVTVFHDPSGLPVLFVVYDRERWSVTDNSSWVISLLLTDAAEELCRPVCSCGWTPEGRAGEYGCEALERLTWQLQPPEPVHEDRGVCGAHFCGCRTEELTKVLRVHGGEHGCEDLTLGIPLPTG